MRDHAVLAIGLAVLAGCSSDVVRPEPQPSVDEQLKAAIRGLSQLTPTSAPPPQDRAQVELGRALFFDKILSGNRDVSCSTCHDVAAALGDGRSLSVGTGGTGRATERRLGPGRRFTTRSAPTLLSSGPDLLQLFWDGRLINSLGHFSLRSNVTLPAGLSNIIAAQAMLPVLDRVEMRGEAGDQDVFGNPNELAMLDDASQIWEALLMRLLAIPEYVAMFNAAFPGTEPLRFEHAARALAAFQIQHMTRTRSPFDRYLEGDNRALSTAEKRGGLLFFTKARCSSCHFGPNLGSLEFTNVGAPQIGPGGTREPPLDLGAGEQSSSDQLRFGFRAAPLRNVELTAPYFHSGAYRTLEAVVRHYNDAKEALRTYDPSQLDSDVRPLYHGESATVDAVLETLDVRLRSPLGLTDTEILEVVAFLKSLTDPAARVTHALVPLRVPSGLPLH